MRHRETLPKVRNIKEVQKIEDQNDRSSQSSKKPDLRDRGVKNKARRETVSEEIMTTFSKSSERHKSLELETATNLSKISRKTHLEAL